MDLRPSQNLKKDHFANGVVSFLLIYDMFLTEVIFCEVRLINHLSQLFIILFIFLLTIHILSTNSIFGLNYIAFINK